MLPCFVLNNHLKEYRLNYNLTQSEVASAVGVSKNAISSYERGEYNPTIEVAFKLAFFFDCDINDLFDVFYD